MIMTDKPLSTYLPMLKEKALKCGYTWIMILVARELDFTDGYKELFSGWSSFDSITGKKIMFLFSNNSGDQIGLNYNMGEMDVCSGLSTTGSKNSPFGMDFFHIKQKDLVPSSDILEAQTSSVDSLKDYFNLKECDVPCLLMLSTMKNVNEKEARYIFSLNDSKAYEKVKSIVSTVEDLLKKYDDVLSPEIINKTMTNRENRFCKAKKDIEARLCGEDSTFTSAEELIEFIEKKEHLGQYLKDTYNHKTISSINRYRDLLRNNPNIAISVKQHELNMNRLSQFNFETNYVLHRLQTHHNIERANDSFSFAVSIIEEFKRWIELRQGYIAIAGSNEKVVQKNFDLLAEHICEETNWDLSPETNSGKGPVDFKISRGNDKTVIEFKLSSNSQCVHGLEVQIEEYAKAEKTEKKIFLLIDNGHASTVKAVLAKEEDMKKNGLNPAKVIVADATPKKSASKM